ncbi:MAG: glycosyl hydrolase, partial [Armatimonadota bacterium]
MRPYLLLLALLLLPTIAFAQTPEQLQRNFVAPPASARPQTWWHWMNGNISKEGITLDLEAMQ